MKPTRILMNPCVDLYSNDNLLGDSSKFWKVVGFLHNLTNTWPDLAFSINKISQFMQSPTNLHWKILKRILRCISTMLFHRIHLRKSTTLALEAFSNTIWGWGDSRDRKGHGAYLIYFGSNLISLSSKKQPTMSCSTMEAEYRSVADNIVELEWIKMLLIKLGYTRSSWSNGWSSGVTILSSGISCNLTLHIKSKHFAMNSHFVHEKVIAKTLEVRFVRSKDQLADLLTKSLSRSAFEYLQSNVSQEIPLRLRGSIGT